MGNPPTNYAEMGRKGGNVNATFKRAPRAKGSVAATILMPLDN